MSEVTFIRKDGRIIPIRKKSEKSRKQPKQTSERKKQVQQGAAAVAGGVAVGAATGGAAAQLVKQSGVQRIKARNDFRIARATLKAVRRGEQSKGQMTLGFERDTARKFAKEAASRRDISNMMFRARVPLLIGGSAVAAGLISAGADKIRGPRDQRSVARKTSDKVSLDGAVMTGVATTYALGIGRRPTQAFKAGRAFVKGIRRPSTPIKTKLGTIRFD